MPNAMIFMKVAKPVMSPLKIKTKEYKPRKTQPKTLQADYLVMAEGK